MFGKKKKKKSHGRHTHANYICALQTNLFSGFPYAQLLLLLLFFSNRDRDALNAWGLKGS